MDKKTGKILVVDDDEDILQAFEEACGSCGYRKKSEEHPIPHEK
jgi:DNA-binding NtrC family response regulator